MVRKSIRVFFGDDEEGDKVEFAQRAAELQEPMSARLLALLRLDVAYWKRGRDLVREAEERARKIQPPTLADIVRENLRAIEHDVAIGRRRLDEIAAGAKPSEVELLQVAIALDLPEKEIREVYARSFQDCECGEASYV